MCQRILLSIIISSVCALSALAQDTSAARQRVEALRAQLAEAQAKEAELQVRLQQLDEALKPENIERSLALVGSTRPEELREQRRRQLETEKKGVQAQLDQLAQSRARLEGAILTAEGEIYRQSAEPSSSVQTPAGQPPAVAPAEQPSANGSKQAVRKRSRARRPRRSRRPGRP
jgi:chromosome segregation ATPase